MFLTFFARFLREIAQRNRRRFVTASPTGEPWRHRGIHIADESLPLGGRNASQLSELKKAPLDNSRETYRNSVTRLF